MPLPPTHIEQFSAVENERSYPLFAVLSSGDGLHEGQREPMENEALRAGQEALARGAWDEAYASFQAALHGEETAGALEGLGMAAWWLDDAAVTFDARERAYRLYRQA